MATQPTLTKRPAEERGQANHGWRQARFTFSFADYYDPNHMGFKALLVMNNDTIQPGSWIHHSEFNPSQENQTHLHQIWLQPNERDGELRYAEKPLGKLAKPDALTLLFSNDGRDDSTSIRQDAEIYFGRVEKGASITVLASKSTPHVWVQMITGDVSILSQSLTIGDGLALEKVPDEFTIEATTDSQALLFRLS